MPSRTPRPKQKRRDENQLYIQRATAAGIVVITVRVPSPRVPEIKAIALDMRREAKLMLDGDMPSADQILQIHAVCRELELPIPVDAFETRATAAAWLHAHEFQLGRRRVHIPRHLTADP